MRCPHRRLLAAACALATIVPMAASPLVGTQPARGAQFHVTNVSDLGAGSLRQALLDAAAAPGADDVVVAPGLGTISPTAELAWTDSGMGANPVTIEGNGVVVDFGGASRGFADDRGRGVTIRNMEITGVAGAAPHDAAPVVSQGGDVVVVNCSIHDNHATSETGDVAGAVLSEGGDVVVTSCTMTRNSGAGPGDGAGAVLSEGGAVDVRDSVFDSNSVTGEGDGAGAVLSEGGRVDVADSQFLSNVAQATYDACGGVASEGGDVVVLRSTFTCNRGTSTYTGRTDAAGGLLSEWGDATVTSCTFVGNAGAISGTGLAGNAYLTRGADPVVTDTTIDDDTSVCAPVIESFFLPKLVRARFNARTPSKSSLVAVGILDTGPGEADLASAATIDIGGVHVEVPGLTLQGTKYVVEGQGLVFSVKPNPYGSSRAKFRLAYTGDLTGKIDADGPLAFRFENAAADGECTVVLGKGRFGLGRVRGTLVEPNLFIQRSGVVVRGPGKDALNVLVGLAAAGTVPGAASDLRIVFADVVDATIPASAFRRRGATDVFAGDAGGVTAVVIDYRRERIAITGKRLDCSSFVEGGNPVLLSVTYGTDARAVRVRMGRVGRIIRY